MSIAASLVPEFEHELGLTRRALALVPSTKASWTPHPKSFTLSGLALHLANFPQWGLITLTQPELDLAGGGPADTRTPFSTTEALLAAYDAGVATLRAALAGMSDAEMMAPWSLKMGPVTVFTMPRVAVLRTSVLNHMIHHRGQLTVYLRLLDVPLPDLYGPSADTKAG